MNKRNNHSIRLDEALTEVMRRQAAAKPQLPADFSQRVADATMARRRKARLRTIVGWSAFGAVAAALLLVFFLLQKPASPVEKQIAEMPTMAPSTHAPSDSTFFEPLYKQIAQFSTENPNSSDKAFPHRGRSQGVLDYSKLAPGVYIEIDEEGDTVYVVISNQNVPAPPKSVLPEVNIAERMKEAEEFDKRLRQEFDSIHWALNR
jgi:hypothetical protein